MLIVRKTFGFKSWQGFSMQLGEGGKFVIHEISPVQGDGRSFIRASRLQELDWGAKVFALLFL